VLLVLKPMVLRAGEAAGNGLAGVGNALVGAGLGCPNGVVVGWVKGLDGEADADAGCGNPPPPPNVKAGAAAGVEAPFVLNPLLLNPLAVPLFAPKLNGAGLDGVAEAPKPLV
jgi:hypothetical protein